MGLLSSHASGFFHEQEFQEKKVTYLLSSSYRLTVPERRWVDEHQATVTKLGRFHVGAGFLPLQMSMARTKKQIDTTSG